MDTNGKIYIYSYCNFLRHLNNNTTSSSPLSGRGPTSPPGLGCLKVSQSFLGCQAYSPITYSPTRIWSFRLAFSPCRTVFSPTCLSHFTYPQFCCQTVHVCILSLCHLNIIVTVTVMSSESNSLFDIYYLHFIPKKWQNIFLCLLTGKVDSIGYLGVAYLIQTYIG